MSVLQPLHIALVAASLLAPAESPTGPEQAQVPPAPAPHQGHFVSVGLHYGGLRARDTHRDGWRPLSHGPLLSIRAGEAITSWLDLGVDLGLGLGVGPDSLRLGRVTAHARWYPFEHWFLHTGLGLGASGGPDPDYDGFDRGRFGELYVVGLGTNRYVTRSTRSGGFALSPVLQAQVGPDPAFTTMALWIGLEFTWWSGLSRNKLRLPPERAYR
ncbi:MAG: hypothetical protein ACRBN8_09255 [Nannocystales bacterium]